SKGALWFGMDKGLIHYQDGAATRYTTENGLPSNDVKAIHEARDGTLWIGTYGGVVMMSVPPAMLGGSNVAKTRPALQAVLTEWLPTTTFARSLI
ncbi:MAG: hypothetical protein M3371_12355, partial [Acidobacteriota bacterium]|nr:hypothetical protein [Acidobacteriota bacterium]